MERKKAETAFLICLTLALVNKPAEEVKKNEQRRKEKKRKKRRGLER